MRTIFIALIISIMCCSIVYAQNPPVGYIGLFADSDRSVTCVQGTGFYPVEMWIWCLPSEGGMRCVEFAVSYPDNIIKSTVTESPHTSVSLGNLEDGMSICMIECQWSWLWTHHQQLWVTDPAPGWIEIVGHPDLGWAQFAPCYPGY